MSITIYTNSSDKKVIGKTLTQISVNPYVLLENCSIITPQVKLKFNSAILSANYAYIEEFHRYYFIDDVTILSGAILQLNLSIDVLETYKTQIKALTCIVKRNTNVFNKYLDDPYFQAQNKKQIQIKKIESSAFYPHILSSSSDCFVLTVAQGG